MTIELYTWSTPNGRKVSIALEELAWLPAHPINITKDEQFAPDFLAISPNNKIPAIVDPDGPDGAPLSAVRDRRDPALTWRRRPAASCRATPRARQLPCSG